MTETIASYTLNTGKRSEVPLDAALVDEARLIEGRVRAACARGAAPRSWTARGSR